MVEAWACCTAPFNLDSAASSDRADIINRSDNEQALSDCLAKDMWFDASYVTTCLAVSCAGLQA